MAHFQKYPLLNIFIHKRGISHSYCDTVCVLVKRKRKEKRKTNNNKVFPTKQSNCVPEHLSIVWKVHELQ